MKNSKINPRKILISKDKVDKMLDESISTATKIAYTIIFTVLYDKEDFTREDLSRIKTEIDDLSDSIVKDYVSINDLSRVLKDELGIIFK